ncbi:DegV family protein [Aquihabitans sp. McL0605]|uniref:DegV family protein n=1 Tax=Aquihabitans sp. McL0605 TaxID=3415671 RepID=UPI003CF1E19F
MPVKIVTDSAADLPPEQAAAHGIRIVPLTIRFGDDEYTDGVDLTPQAFYDKMAQLDVLPATAAPSPGAFEAAFREAGADGDPVVCINLSSALSATMQSAQTAAKAIGDDLDLTVLDSTSITAGLGMQVLAAAELAEQGGSPADIVALIEDLRSRTRVFGALDTLENLKKGGRIGGAQAMLGSILSIKPIIDISTGTVTEAGKQRTRKKSLVWLRDRLFEVADLESVAVAHGCSDDVDELIELISPRYAPEQISTWTIGPVIGAHGGPRVMGLVWQDPA